MERYVWELTRELQQLGHRVSVICERCHVEKPESITVVELGEIAPRPRWLSLLRFSRRVARFLADHPGPDRVIHSHERLNTHHLTTFHGPPFATVLDKPWWRLISLRIAMQLYLERRELSTPHHVVPNSRFISQSLAHYYPELAHKLTEPIVPGVVPGALRETRRVPPDGGIVGFVGKEWQRKGLPRAVAMVAALRRTRPNVQLHVVGPAAADVAHLFADWRGGYKLLGWNDQAPYAAFDVLLHPAKAEPYGMVISEAMAAKVPVLISDVCGAAAHVTAASGAVLPLSAPLDAWVQALDQELSRVEPVPQFERSWRKVAEEYVEIYSGIFTEPSRC
jgi:UDP-glucose:(heptosyl)LPS alpha-1,3-glucosyltransferase